MNSNSEIDALKHRIKELEDTIVHYKAYEGLHVDMLERIQEILDETTDGREVI